MVHSPAKERDEMKKIMLVASLAVVAVIAAPVATAFAVNKFKGKCEIQGLARFGRLNVLIQAKRAYSFESEARIQGPLTTGFAGGKPGKCNGEAENAAGVNETNTAFTGKAVVNTAVPQVEGNLACLVSESEGKAKFQLTLIGAGAKTFTINLTLAFHTQKPGELLLEFFNNAGTVKQTEGTASFTDPGNAGEKEVTDTKCGESKLEERPFDLVFPSKVFPVFDPTVGGVATVEE
jgi:hypothetical protein